MPSSALPSAFGAYKARSLSRHAFFESETLFGKQPLFPTPQQNAPAEESASATDSIPGEGARKHLRMLLPLPVFPVFRTFLPAFGRGFRSLLLGLRSADGALQALDTLGQVSHLLLHLRRAAEQFRRHRKAPRLSAQLKP